jgi:quercetin dioxygenase-like cupin family protein
MDTTPVPGLKRTDLQRHDLSIPGREVIQNRVDITPDAPPVRHKHPGEEIIYVLEGTLEYSIDGREPATFNPGEVLLVPPRRSTRCATSVTGTRPSSPPTSSRRASHSSCSSSDGRG